MLRHSRIVVSFRLILDYEDQVKPGKNRDWKVDVLTHVPVRLVSAQRRIGRCQDRGPSIQSRNDSTLGHAHSLLFKRLVYRDPIIRPHLIKFVDASHPFIGEDQSACLKHHPASLLTQDSCSKTGSSRTTPRSIQAPRSNPRHVLQQLALGSVVGDDTVRNESVGPRDFYVVHICGFTVVDCHYSLTALSCETPQSFRACLQVSQAYSLLVRGKANFSSELENTLSSSRQKGVFYYSRVYSKPQ